MDNIAVPMRLIWEDSHTQAHKDTTVGPTQRNLYN